MTASWLVNLRHCDAQSSCRRLACRATGGWIIGDEADVDVFASRDDVLAEASADAAASARRRERVDQGVVLAEWERRQRRRPSLLLRAVDNLPYLGPLLVAMATSIWLYDLLLLVRLLVLDG